jgi:hypothetical protein
MMSDLLAAVVFQAETPVSQYTPPPVLVKRLPDH